MFIQPMSATMPAGPFDALLAAKGVRLTWFKSHSCPCVAGGFSADGGYRSVGTADPSCRQCRGFGTYWDAPIGPFTGLLTYFASAPSPIEPGIRVDDKFGQHVESEPVVTIPHASPLNVSRGLSAQQLAAVWEGASLNDMFVECDATTRYNALLKQGDNDVLPFQQGLRVAASGAVKVYDSVNKVAVLVQGYEVQGARVTLPTGAYPDGTGYAVEFTASPMFVAHRAAGAFPHVRPFGNGTVELPRRLHIQTLDFWTRQNAPNAGTAFPAVGC